MGQPESCFFFGLINQPESGFTLKETGIVLSPLLDAYFQTRKLMEQKQRGMAPNKILLFYFLCCSLRFHLLPFLKLFLWVFAKFIKQLMRIYVYVF